MARPSSYGDASAGCTGITLAVTPYDPGAVSTRSPWYVPSPPGVSVTVGQPPTAAPTEVAGVQASQTLPRTGARSSGLVLLSVGLLVVGLVLVVLGDGARVLGVRRH